MGRQESDKHLQTTLNARRTRHQGYSLYDLAASPTSSILPNGYETSNGENPVMNKEQLRELFTKWTLYKPRKQYEIIIEYLDSGGSISSQDDFLEFIAKKIELKRPREKRVATTPCHSPHNCSI